MSAYMDSSDDGSDDEERMAFTDQNDFEGGQWIDGEFYYRKQKKGKSMSKKEAIYGIFTEDASDEEQPKQKDKYSYGKSSGTSAYSKPFSFVSGGVQKAAEEESATNDVEEEKHVDSRDPMEVDVSGQNDEDEEDKINREKFNDLLREGGAGSAGKYSSNDEFRKQFLDENNDGDASTQNDAPSVVVPKKPLPRDYKKELGNWQKHTKGFGMKMLEKFGFKGRLGKNEEGIVKPVEVKVRPNQLGLGYGGFKEAAELKANREIERDYRGKPEEQKPEEKVEKEPEIVGGWKKSVAKKKKAKKVYKSAAELIEEEKTVVAKQVILDMRGPQTKVIDVAGVESSVSTIDIEEHKPKLGQELIHNVRLIVDLAETKIFTLDRKIQGHKQDLVSLRAQAIQIEKQANEEETRVTNIEQLLQLIRRVKSKMKEDPDAVSLSSLQDLFRALKTRFPVEYRRYHLFDLFTDLVLPKIVKDYKDWNPLMEHDRCLSLVYSWKDIFVPDDSDAEAIQVDDDYYNFMDLIEQVVVPSIRNSILKSWNVKAPEDCVALIEELYPVLSVPSTADPKVNLLNSLLVQSVFPKLAVEIERWNPRTDPIHIHSWVHPWIPHLGKNLEALYPNIRFTLASVLKDWNPGDETAHIVVSPWKGVWDAQSFDAFLVRSVIPKLVNVLRDYLIDPNEEDLLPLQSVLRWADLLPLAHTVSLLEGEFFPKWLVVLHLWLSNEPDCAEVWHWYARYKAVFPSDLIQNYRIKVLFNKALILMNDKLENRLSKDSPRPLPNQISYHLLFEKYSKQQRKLHFTIPKAPSTTAGSSVSDKPTQKATSLATDASNVSLRELVEQFAAESDVAFTPSTKKRAFELSNKVMYLFGNVTCYLDQGVIFAEDPENKKNFIPVSMGQLLELSSKS